MKCPRCSSELKLVRYKDIEVDRCPTCEGLWLDHAELDQLEKHRGGRRSGEEQPDVQVGG